MQIEGKVVLVTGSSSGIGESVARAFAAEGARVVVNSSSSVEAGKAVAASLPDALYVRGNVADARDARAIVTQALSHYGRLDVLVNNAGTTVRIPHTDFDAVTPEVWHRILDVNVIGTWQVTQAAIPALRESGDGCIVNVGSLAGLRPSGSSIPYAASKAAVHHLTLLLANALGPTVRVNAVAPGLIDTPWTADWSDLRDAVKVMAPLQRSGIPDDVATLCLGLVRSDYVTGQVVACDGGLSLR
ncbi:MAG TPA: glucose 1-dehydrogenase [Candidatus Angelobacter sp.]|jgi:ketoreductase RED2|nr:glucose 1-dehydrogenase [Candidatus Angelobacter sp.]